MRQRERMVGNRRPGLWLTSSNKDRAGGRHAGGNAREDRYERMDKAFHQRLRDGYLDIARRNPERCAVVDATKDEKAVHEWIRTLVHNRLGLKLP